MFGIKTVGVLSSKGLIPLKNTDDITDHDHWWLHKLTSAFSGIREWRLLLKQIVGSNTIRQNYYAPQVRPNLGSNSQPPDHDSTIHIIKMPAPTT